MKPFPENPQTGWHLVQIEDEDPRNRLVYAAQYVEGRDNWMITDIQGEDTHFSTFLMEQAFSYLQFLEGVS